MHMHTDTPIRSALMQIHEHMCTNMLMHRGVRTGRAHTHAETHPRISTDMRTRILTSTGLPECRGLRPRPPPVHSRGAQAG